MKTVILLCFLSLLGCDVTNAIVVDPFSQREIHQLAIEKGNDRLFIPMSGDIEIESIELRAEKKDGKILSNKMVWKFSSDRDFSLSGNQIEISYIGNIYKLNTSALNNTTETSIKSDHGSVGVGMGQFNFTAGESISKISNKYIHSIELDVPDNLFEVFVNIGTVGDVFVRTSVKSLSSDRQCVWTNIDNNKPSKVASFIRAFYSKISDN